MTRIASKLAADSLHERLVLHFNIIRILFKSCLTKTSTQC
jgi:hypothetical protein